MLIERDVTPIESFILASTIAYSPIEKLTLLQPNLSLFDIYPIAFPEVLLSEEILCARICKELADDFKKRSQLSDIERRVIAAGIGLTTGNVLSLERFAATAGVLPPSS